MARRAWALTFTARCDAVEKSVDEHHERIAVIQRATGVALENLKSHVANLDNKFREAQTWANELLKEQQSVQNGWRRALGNLDTIRAPKDFTFLRRPSTPKMDTNRSTGTLQDYVDVEQVKRAGSQVSTVSQRFARHMDDVQRAVHEIAGNTQGLVNASQSPLPEKMHILEEVETIAKKISSDYEHVLSLPNTPKALSSVSRLALNHTEGFLPSMMEMGHELQNELEKAVKNRNQAIRSAVKHMQTISAIESRLAGVQADISELDVEGDVLDILDEVFHLPILYGSILIESVRRREWANKMKSDSLSLAEELAVYREEEQRRRKKWAKSMGEFLDVADDNTPGVEVNIQNGQGPEWPEVTRKDVEDFIEGLKKIEGSETAVQELGQLFKNLDAPTRQQRRKAKAFKQGSVFDMGRSSLLIRGDDMVRSLRDEKIKLEDRLKGSDSRIRKLEDLLHRQSHISRPLSGNFGQDAPMSPASPRPDTLSRRSSVSSRQMSTNHSPEEKALAQRIVSLEAELITAKETVSKLQEQANTERQSNTDKLHEAQSTKKDLMDNLEAKQREFEDERKYLESETKKLKIRLEETEEEFDRLADRHDGEKHDTDERIKQLETELLEARETSRQDIEKLNDQIKTQHEENDDLRTKNKSLQDQVGNYGKREMDNLDSLQAIHLHLSPGGSPPNDFSVLVKATETLAEGLAIHTKGSEEAVAKLTDENKTLAEQLAHVRGEVEGLKQQVEDGEKERSRTEELLNEEQAKVTAIKSELEDDRNELARLRSKLTAGETGSGTLKDRLAAEESKVATLTEKLAEVESHSHTHDDMVLTWKQKVKDLEAAREQIKSHLVSRGTRSKEISQKLYSHIEKLGQVLEQLGFIIIIQENVMEIRRASKVNNSSLLGETMESSNIVPAIEKPEQSLWAETDEQEKEKIGYEAFIGSVQRFDIHKFSEVIVKRMKDIETLARRWQKDAKGYREKYHRAQGEAHDKIAYRAFKEGDLALFLPTRNPAIRSWAAFNVGAPHYFLREQETHKLQTRDWLLARISKVEERVVDLSKSMNGGANADRRSGGETSDGASLDDDNPFELSDGLRWYLLDAYEEKPGAPSTPGLGKSTVASAHVDAKGSIRLKRQSNAIATTTLTKSLDSRRNSSASKKGVPTIPNLQPGETSGDNNVVPADGDRGSQPRREEAPIFDEVRRDLLSESRCRE